MYVIRRKTECNHNEVVYVIQKLFRYVINQKIAYTDVITFSFADYIRLTAITYQSFGLDKIKHLLLQMLYFLVDDNGLEPLTLRTSSECSTN